MQPEALYAQLAALSASGERYVLATVVETRGSSPQKPGAKLAIRPDGTLLGTIGGGAIEKQIVDAALALLSAPHAPPTRLLETHLTRDLAMCCGGSMTVFLERQEPARALWLFGAGHVHRAVAALAAEVGFRVTVIDEREAWLTPERFPRAEQLLEDPALAARKLTLGPSDFVAIATHDHALDEDVLVQLGERPLGYVGMIGSERKSLRIRERLRQRGLAEVAVARVQCPMGLDIGAQSPEEIAVAILAELIRIRASQAARGAAPQAVRTGSDSE